MLGVLFSTPVWPIAPKHFYLTSQEPEFLHIRESCQGHDKKTYYAQPLRQPRFPRGWIFLWISSSIKFYIREWKEEFFTSFLFYTQTHRKKSLMRPFFFLFSFRRCYGRATFCWDATFITATRKCLRKSWQKSWIESEMLKRDVEFLFWKKERGVGGVFFFSTFSIMYYILLEWQRRIFGFFFVLGAVFVICSILIASNNGLEK